jgi:hypothetical protein
MRPVTLISLCHRSARSAVEIEASWSAFDVRMGCVRGGVGVMPLLLRAHWPGMCSLAAGSAQ